MKLKVKYFGLIAEFVGASEQSVIAKGLSVQDLRHQLETEYPKLKTITYQIAVNQKITSDQYLFNDGDELALLPPFAGG